MKKAKPEHRRSYWKYHVAAHSFEHARNLASQLLDLSNTDPQFYPLMISLHVLYARPFRHAKETRRLLATCVPTNLLSVHDMVLQMRDKIFARHDKDSKITDTETGVDLFQLVVVVKDGIMKPGVQIVFPTEDQLNKVHDLCDYLYRTCMSKGHEALNKCIAATPGDGIYRVSTEFEGRSPLLIKSELSSDQSIGHLKETKRRPQSHLD